MSAVVFLIEQVATGLYILIGISAFLALRAYGRASSDYRGTYFELEREMARERRGSAFAAFIVLVELALIVVGVQLVVAPTLRDAEPTEIIPIAIVSDGVFRTPTPAPPISGPVIDASGVDLRPIDPALQIQPTPTITPTPVGTIVPNPPPTDCTSPELAFLQIPANGMIVFQPIAVNGIATAENFAFYRFEIRGESTFGSFASLGVDGTQPLTEVGALGQFSPAFYTPGEYQFRLSVFDITNTLQAACTYTIYISAPIPTATPFGTAAP